MKLSDDEVISIYSRLKNGEKQANLVNEFGASKATISRIALCRRRGRLQLDPLPPNNYDKVKMGKPMVEMLAERSKLNPDNGCIEWMNSRGRGGYGLFELNGKMHMAHKLSYQTHIGPVPDGLFVLHSCDNARCINPDHLHIGTHEDNMREMVERNRSVRGEKHALSKLTTESVLRIVEGIKSGMTTIELASEFNICRTTVSSIMQGTIWPHVTGIKPGDFNGRSPLSMNDARRIREMKKTGLTNKQIGDMFGVHNSVISRIVNNVFWKEKQQL